MQTPVTRDVIVDLLPLYLAGEASADTRVLVEAYLRTDPELAAQVSAGATFDLSAAAAPALDASLELRTVRRTRGRLAAQRWLFGLACAFTAIALSIQISAHDGRLSVRLLLLDYPAAMAVPLVAALVCWGAYVALRRGGRGASP